MDFVLHSYSHMSFIFRMYYSTSGNRGILGGTTIHYECTSSMCWNKITLSFIVLYTSPYFRLAREIIEWRKKNFTRQSSVVPTVFDANLSHIAGPAVLRSPRRERTGFRRPGPLRKLK